MVSTSPRPEDAFAGGVTAERFVALRDCLVPRARNMDAAQRAESLRLVATFVAQLSASSRRKLALFLVVIDVLALLRGGRTFRRLAVEDQEALLRNLFDHPIGLLRKGFWGLNTLAKLSVYGQTSLYEDIGYRLRKNPA